MKYLKSLKERLLENQMHNLAIKHNVEVKDEDVDKLGFQLKDLEGEEAESKFKEYYNISDSEETETEEVAEESGQDEIVEEPEQ